MTSNLAYPLTAGVEAIGSDNEGNEFTWTPTSCSYASSKCAMNGLTQYNSSTKAYYYSWYAATAETALAEASAETDAGGSICPAYWRLPSNYSVDPGKSYGSLTNAYGMTTDGQGGNGNRAKLEAVPLNFARLGRYWAGNGGFEESGNSGAFWSATSYDGNKGYNFVYASGGTQPQKTNTQSNGYPIRCVAI